MNWNEISAVVSAEGLRVLAGVRSFDVLVRTWWVPLLSRALPVESAGSRVPCCNMSTAASRRIWMISNLLCVLSKEILGLDNSDNGTPWLIWRDVRGEDSSIS